MRDSVVIYRSFYEASKTMSPEEFKELWINILRFSLDEEEPEEIKSPMAEAIFVMAQPQISANMKKHDDGCKGGAPKGNQNARKKQPENNPKQPLVDSTNNQRLKEKQPNENENENENVNVNVKEKKKKRTSDEPKHTHGEYKHVRLTDEQFEKLGVDLGEEMRSLAIKKLDEYIQERPTYKSNDHNLAIRRWVVDAVNEAKLKNKSKPHNQMMTRDYNFSDIEKQMLGG